jgi:hypothetical protein
MPMSLRAIGCLVLGFIFGFPVYRVEYDIYQIKKTCISH